MDFYLGQRVRVKDMETEGEGIIVALSTSERTAQRGGSMIGIYIDTLTRGSPHHLHGLSNVKMSPKNYHVSEEYFNRGGLREQKGRWFYNSKLSSVEPTTVNYSPEQNGDTEEDI